MEGTILLYVRPALARSQMQCASHSQARQLTATGFYHSDRPLTQQALARALSYSLVPTLPRSTLHRFLRAFWITICRDFHALDRLRLDKYLFLIRCYVGVGFEVFLKGQNAEGGKARKGEKKRKRDAEAQGGKKKRSRRGDGKGKAGEEEEEGDDDVESKWPGLSSYISIIEEGPLYPLDFDPDQEPADDGAGGSVPIPHGPDGLRYHLIDLWLDELEKVLEFEEGAEGEEESTSHRKVKGEVPMDLLLRPIETLRTQGAHKPVRTRATETLEDDRLVEWGFKERKADGDGEDESEDEWGGFGDA